MFYKNAKAIVCSAYGDSHLFDTDNGVMQGDTLASYLSIRCKILTSNIHRSYIKENGFTLKKGKKHTISRIKLDRGKVRSDLVLLANTPD